MTIERRICIPDDVSFADLKLQRHTDGAVSFEWGPITRICEASDIDPALFRAGPPDNVSALIVHWYIHHLEQGGERDPIQDDLIAETLAEEAAGQRISLEPGRA